MMVIRVDCWFVLILNITFAEPIKPNISSPNRLIPLRIYLVEACAKFYGWNQCWDWRGFDRVMVEMRDDHAIKMGMDCPSDCSWWKVRLDAEEERRCSDGHYDGVDGGRLVEFVLFRLCFNDRDEICVHALYHNSVELWYSACTHISSLVTSLSTNPIYISLTLRTDYIMLDGCGWWLILALDLVGGHKFWHSAAPSTGWESTANSCDTILPPVVRHNTMPDRKDHEIKGTALWKWCGGMK